MATQAPERGQLLIGGEFHDAASGRSFESINPADETVVAQVAEAGPEDVDRAVQEARRALDGPWGKMTAAARGKILWKMAQLLRERLDEVALIETRDTSKTLFDSGKMPLDVRLFDADGNETTLDIPRIIGIFEDAGYDGDVSVEYEGPTDEYEGIEATVALLKRCGVEI